jgi:predicted CXXCH cytochrome family protein
MFPRQLFRAFIPMTIRPGLKAFTASVIVVLAVVFGGTAWAFSTYDGCQDCHGGFEANPYTSLHDGTNWGIDLMQGHWPFLNRNCNACHKSGGRDEVFLNLSSDDTFSKGCVGCHGRDEDVTGNCTGLSGSQGGVEEECGSGAGLRQHHESQVGAGTCSGCHVGDATPVGEHIAPFNYGLDGIVMADSCDGDSTESQHGSTGLDNDGDGQRDGNDSDCQANSPPTQPGMLSVSELTASSVTVLWGASSDDDGDPISYQVDYRRNGEAPWSDGGSTSNTSQPLGGLDAGQFYDVQVTPNDGHQDGPVRSELNLFQTESGGSSFIINAGLNDAWFNLTTNGQGFLISVFPDIKQMFLAWFTFDTERPPEDVTANLGEPGHRWLTAQGPYDGDTATLTIFVTEGGVFDSAEPVATTDPAGDGTMTVEFADCTEGLVNYVITSLDISGEIPIQRISEDNVALCESLNEGLQQDP